MRIERLSLDSFGRFQGKVVELGPGLNVIRGSNEAGKSTVERFVRGMLYGFAKPGLKKRMMLDEHERYRPWSGAAYGGRLVFALDDGRRFRVERAFDPHAVRVFDEATGQELAFDEDRRSEPAFAQALLGLSQVEFTSTACIGQLETSRLEPGAAKALAGRMAAPSVTGREDDSAVRAVAVLEERRTNEIGTERAPTKPLGRAAAELGSASARLEEARRARDANLANEARLRRLEARLGALESDGADLRRRIAAAESAEARRRIDRLAGEIDRAEAREAEARMLEPKRERLAPLEAIPPQDARRATLLLESIERSRKDAGDAAAEIRRRADDLDRLERDLDRLGVRGDPADVAARVEELERMIDARRQELASLARERYSLGVAGCAILAFVSAVAGVALGWTVSPPWGFALALVAAPLGALAARLGKAARAAVSGLTKDVESGLRELQSIQDGTGCATADDLKHRLRDAAGLRRKIESAREILRVLKERAGGAAEGAEGAEALESLLGLLRPAAPLSARIAAAVESGEPGRAVVDEFEDLCRAFTETSAGIKAAREAAADAWRRAGDGAREIGSADAALAEALAARDPARARALLAAALEADGTVPEAEEAAPASELRRRLEAVGRETLSLTAEASRLRGQIEKTYEDMPDVASLEREKSGLDEKVESLRLALRAVERAIGTINRVAERMHRDFAPRLALRVGPIVRELTGGRYGDVRIGDELDLRAEAPEAGGLRAAEDLSGGTLDQFHFALRIAAAIELAADGERPPVICDETLVQYDDERACACVGYLARLAAEGFQVILFTCRQREEAAARGVGARVIALP